MRKLDSQPLVTDNSQNILRRQRLKNRYGEHNFLRLSVPDKLLLQIEILMMIDVIVAGILDPDPERLGQSVELVVPAKLGRERDLDTEHRARDRMQRRLDLNRRQIRHALFHSIAHFGMPQKHTDLLGVHFAQLIQREILVLDLGEDLEGKVVLELSHGTLKNAAKW